VTGDEVTAAIDDGAATLKAVAKATGACTVCGSCRERICSMIGERARPCPLKVLTTAASSGLGAASSGLAAASSELAA
jgi:bacterioferritin-associated ferredoxin